MFKRTSKDGFPAAAMAAAVVLLGACDGEKNVATLDSSVREFSSGVSAQQHAAIHTAEVAIDATGFFHAANASEPAPHALVEKRHFDVYNRTRTLFDTSADAGQILTHDSEDRLQPVVITFSTNNVEELPACTMRTLRNFD
jgi:hypothetical protein